MLRNFAIAPVITALALAAGVAPAAAQTTNGPPAARSQVPPNGRIAMHVSALVMEDLKQFIPDDWQSLLSNYLQSNDWRSLSKKFAIEYQQHRDAIRPDRGKEFSGSNAAHSPTSS